MLRPSAFVIEIDGATAGLAVAVEREFRFFASTSRAWPMDGRRFRSLAALRGSVRATLAGRSRTGKLLAPGVVDAGVRIGGPNPDCRILP
jgi:hypothetical protein